MIDLTDPSTRQLIRDLLEAQYLVKFLRRIRLGTPVPPLPGPDPGPFSVKPSPQLSVDPRDFLLGELMMNALGDPNPQPNEFSFINQIKASGLHVEVAKDLLAQFEKGASTLKAELKTLENKP